MKSKIAVLCLLFAISFHFSEAAAGNGKILFLTDAHKKGGYLEAITKEALKKTGYEMEVKHVPWKRALNAVMCGENQALLAAYYTEERAEKMAYTESIGQTEIVFFKKKGTDLEYSKLEDLKACRIGMIRGAAISREFDSADYLNKEEVSSPALNINKLLAGRVDLIVEQKKVILNFLRNHFPGNINSLVALEPPLKVSRYYNAFSRKYPGYERKVNDFNIGLQMIKADGTYGKIIDEHTHP